MPAPANDDGAQPKEPRPVGDFPAVSVTVPGIDPDRLMLAAKDTRTAGPEFSVGEMTKLLFGRSAHTLRWREAHQRLGHRVPAGTPYEHPAGTSSVGSPHTRLRDSKGREVRLAQGAVYRHPGGVTSTSAKYSRLFAADGTEIGARTAGGARRYSLSDAERMIHAMASIGVVTGEEAALMLTIVMARAALAGYLPPDVFFRTPQEGA